MQKTSRGWLVVAAFSLLGMPSWVAAQKPCSDGNAFDGDCCSSASIQEEHRWGDPLLTIPCLNGADNVCEDGVDNDGDGLYDSEDPECSTLFALQEYAVLGIDANAPLGVRTGSNVKVLHGSLPPTTSPTFPVSGATCSGLCSCADLTGPFGTPPSPPTLQSYPIPDCQAAGLVCDTDADCAPLQFPKGVSTAAVCGGNMHLKREGIYEGFVAVLGNTRFARGYLGPRNLVNLGSFFVSDGGTERLDGEPPWVGHGLCTDLLSSCTSDADCIYPNVCEGRFQLNDASNPFVDRSGSHPLWDDCQAAITTDLIDVANKVKNRLPSTTLPPGPGILANGSIKLRAIDPPLTLNFPSGTTILDIPSIKIAKGAQLILNGQPDSTVVIKINRSLSIGGAVGVTLSGGLTANNVLWSLEDTAGSIQLKRDTIFAGTILTAERKKILLGSQINVAGALLGRRVDIRDSSVVNHYPFTPLLPTDLELTKTGSPDPVVAGEPLTYTLTVSNNGFSTAPGVVVTDILPPSVTFSGYTASQGECQEDPIGTIKCFVGTLGEQGSITPPDSATITLTVDTDPSFRGTLNNTASAVANVEELNPADNTGIEVVTGIGVSDLEITKTDNDPVIAGQSGSLTYTLTITNHGPSDAIEGGGVTVVDSLPAGVSLLSAVHTPANGASGSCVPSGNTVVCSLGSMAAGETDTITLVVTPDCDVRGVIANTCSVSTGGETDPVPANNLALEETMVSGEADLSSSKLGSPNPVIAGHDVTYTVTVNNAGPSSATNVVVTDELPFGTTFKAAGSSASCSASGQTVTCDIPSVTCGGSTDVTIVATVDSSVTQGTNLSNNITSLLRDESDVNSGNDASFADVAVNRRAELSITKTDLQATAVPGTQVAYTITVTNNGPSDSTGAQVVDSFPAILSGVQWNCEGTGGAFCTAAGTNDINDPVSIPAGESVTYIVTADIDPAATGLLVNTATVDSEPGTLAELNSANNTSTDTDTLTPQADLSITKLDNPDPVTVGATLQYTLTVQNNGPSNAPNSVVTDSFPTEFTGATWTCSASGGAVCPNAMGSGSINETIASFPTGGQVVYAVSGGTTKPAVGSNVNNTASVAVPMGVTDLIPGNNSSTISTQFYTPTFTPTNTPTHTPTSTPTPTHVAENVIYVSSTLGSSGGDGSREFPVNTIQAGVNLASGSSIPDVCVSVGAYNETVTLANGIVITGDFSADGNWTPNAAGASVLNGPAGGALVANNITDTPTQVRNMTIISANASGGGASSYAVKLTASLVTLTNNVITAGNGAAGTTGGNGTNGGGGTAATAAPGNGCENSTTLCASCGRPAGGAGSGATNCTAVGGNSGAGGNGGNAGACSEASPLTSGSGLVGGTSSTGTAGGPAVGGVGCKVVANNGNTGSAGATGGNGAAGASFGASGLNYTPANGGTAGNGGNGGGGGGASGGGGGDSSCDTYGGGGGGGGSGGCGGTASTFGSGGGGSFPVWINGGSVTMSSNTITRGTGGNGGNGGATRGTGGAGGGGRAGGGIVSGDDARVGGTGGTGGVGGAGGFGGGGGGGPTVGIVCSGAATTSCSANTHLGGTPGTGGTSGGNPGTTGANTNSNGCGGGC